MKTDNKYDVIIIGAGIGGLVCGCYLAREGLKVLIVEKHYKVGGYCTSFKRNGFNFDVAVHYIGAARYKGEINRILEHLNLNDRIKFLRFDPCDKILLPAHTIYIRKYYKETIEEFQSQFPQERDKIVNFFNLVMSKDFFYLYGKLRKLSFKNLLDEHFDSEEIKGAIGTILGNMGLPPSRISALTAVFLYREFILDPGYYPKGGMQVFSDSLAQRFKELGGDILLSSKVDRIILRNNKVIAAELKGNNIIYASYVVSNADATQTFTEMIDKVDKGMIKKIKKLEPSISAFAIYLGIDMNFENLLLKDKCAVWKFFTYDMEKCYGTPEHNITSKDLDYFACTFPSIHDPSMAPLGKSTMGIFICAPYKDKKFWDEYKTFISSKLLNGATKLFPEIENKINTKVVATPYAFHRYTLNKNGAIYGWASTPSQIDRSLFPQETHIKGLYLAGHWCTNGLGQGGVSEVAYTGRRAAKLIIKKINKK